MIDYAIRSFAFMLFFFAPLNVLAQAESAGHSSATIALAEPPTYGARTMYDAGEVMYGTQSGNVAVRTEEMTRPQQVRRHPPNSQKR